MRIAILGATSQIAKDLVLSFARHKQHELVLYARRPESVVHWLQIENIEHLYSVANFEAFTTQEPFDAILNFVGVGNPAQAARLGHSIFELTQHFDELALRYIEKNTNCRYIFLSSGAAYCSSFKKPANKTTKAIIDINNLQPQDWYGIAKLYAECRHRALTDLSIIDLRVFNYFSNTQDLTAKFLISEILTAIINKSVFNTSSSNIIRDYLHPEDFYQLITRILTTPQGTNISLDCYSQSPIDKIALIDTFSHHFGLKYKILEPSLNTNTSGHKEKYYSINHQASKFHYKPNWSSLNGIIDNTKNILKTLKEK